MSCDWPIDRTCITVPLPPLDDPPTGDQQVVYDAALAQRNAAEDTAVSVLWALSGRQFGLCPTLVRPCPEFRPYDRFGSIHGYGGGYDGGGVTSYVLSWEGDRWLNWPCGCFGGRCRVNGPGKIHLPGPAHSITEVRIEGSVVDPSTYVLESGDVLYRVGHAWPSQDLSRPVGQPNTWTVEYLRGMPPPAGVANMVGTLANEFLNVCSGGKCRLPRNIVGVTRAGVSYQVYDPKQIYEAGKTGLPEIDLWLSAINPAHITQAPTVR
jgi:hypothetical protein